MTQQDEIVEMARQTSSQKKLPWNGAYIFNSKKQLIEFAKLIAAKRDPKIAIADAYRAGVDSGIAAEREACAKYLDSQNTAITDMLAAEIRARGTSNIEEGINGNPS